MAEYRIGEAVVLGRNDYYWGGKPYLDTIVFRMLPDIQSRITALQTGEIDFTGISPSYVPEIVNNTDIQVMTKVVDMQGSSALQCE